MSSIQKLIQRLLRRPIPKDITWDELTRFLNHFGYQVIENGSSHKSFFNARTNHMISNVVRPHPQKEVKTYVIEKVKRDLKSAGVLEDE